MPWFATPEPEPRQVVEQCARVIGLLSRVRLDAVVARFLRELTEAPEAGVPPRLRSDSHVARQELFQLCDGMKHVELAADHSRQVRSQGKGSTDRVNPVRSSPWACSSYSASALWAVATED